MLVLPRMLLQKYVPYLGFYILHSHWSQLVCLLIDVNRAIVQMPHTLNSSWIPPEHSDSAEIQA